MLYYVYEHVSKYIKTCLLIITYVIYTNKLNKFLFVLYTYNVNCCYCHMLLLSLYNIFHLFFFLSCLIFVIKISKKSLPTIITKHGLCKNKLFLQRYLHTYVCMCMLIIIIAYVHAFKFIEK